MVFILRRSKMSLFTNDKIVYTGNPKEATEKSLELIDGFSIATEYKINTQKLIAFLHTRNN